MDTEQIDHLFGSLLALSIKTEDGSSVDSLGAESSPPDRQTIDVHISQIITEIKTEYRDSSKLHSVSWQSDNDIWTCGTDSIMRLYNLQGELRG